MEGENTDEEFHDSESFEEFHDSDSSVDIFDLFNFCNGILGQDGLLDINQLDEYDEREREEINFPRLIEIWKHSADCSQCADIVAMLGEIRGSLSEDDEETYEERAGDSDINAGNSVS